MWGERIWSSDWDIFRSNTKHLVQHTFKVCSNTKLHKIPFQNPKVVQFFMLRVILGWCWTAISFNLRTQVIGLLSCAEIEFMQENRVYLFQNEAKNFESCLESLKSFIRHWDWGYSGLQAEGNSRTIYATLEDNGVEKPRFLFLALD